jgi:dihydrofolate reductase
MPKLRVNSFSISLDGYGAGADQGLANPLGVGGEALHEWALKTRTFRNMFGPIRGEWPDETWKGWWGDNPPYHVPAFVLTHHERDPIEMAGGTTFHFVTGSIEDALARAKEAAGDKDVRLGGGVATIRQYLTARLIDEMHLAIAPVLLGRGEHLLGDLDLPALGYRCVEHVATPNATHVVLAKKTDA